LGEEPLAGLIHCRQASVVATGRSDGDDEAVLGQRRGVAFEGLLGNVRGLVAGEPLVVAVKLAVGRKRTASRYRGARTSTAARSVIRASASPISSAVIKSAAVANTLCRRWCAAASCSRSASISSAESPSPEGPRGSQVRV
jgi:hypothetical protein